MVFTYSQPAFFNKLKQSLQKKQLQFLNAFPYKLIIINIQKSTLISFINSNKSSTSSPSSSFEYSNYLFLGLPVITLKKLLKLDFTLYNMEHQLLKQYIQLH